MTSSECKSTSSNYDNRFVFNLVRKLYKSGHNLLLSPFSVTSALVMLIAGADGNTRTELIKTILVKNANTLKIANLLYSNKK